MSKHTNVIPFAFLGRSWMCLTVLASAAFLGFLASHAQARQQPITQSKDKDAVKQFLRQKLDTLHKEVLVHGDKAEVLGLHAEGEQAEQDAAQAQEGANPPVQAIGVGPRLVFEVSAYDFGKVVGDAPLVCKFPFKNMGSEKLIINAINTGCGCTAAKLAKMEFAPGEGDSIEITYNPKGSGKQQRSIHVSSNDSQQPNMQITISAQVVPLIEARPQTVQFGQVSVGETRTVQLVIVSRDPQMKITSVQSNGPEVVAELAPDARPEVLVEPELPGVAVINVTLRDNAPVGRVLRLITVNALAAREEGQPQTPQELKVNAFGAVKGELTVNPQLIRFAPVVAGAELSRDAIVTRKDNKPFNILKAEIADSTLPGLTVTTMPYEEGGVRGYKIVLSGNAGPTANNFRGRVVLTTDVPREETHEIQFSGIVRVPPPPTAGAAPDAPAAPPGSKENPIPITPTPASQQSGAPTKPGM